MVLAEHVLGPEGIVMLVIMRSVSVCCMTVLMI